MKKLFVLVALFATVCITKAEAQESKVDPAATFETYKKKIKPLLMEKASITETEADKVIAINSSYYGRIKHFQNLDEAKKKEMTEQAISAEQKEYAGIGLSAEKITLINEFFADQRKKSKAN